MCIRDSSYPEDEMPPVPEATVLTLDAIKETQGGWLGERKIMSGKECHPATRSNE